MTRKDYRAIAKVLSKYTSPDDIYKSRVDAIVSDLATIMEDSTTFDRSKFIKACYLD